mmetsp:Transcript_3485/g.6445  ORF Transcript_3485/g.6445 Transcript_3485/m.6445 type:complete len:789 (-) Transcript_3485:109-2475(-)
MFRQLSTPAPVTAILLGLVLLSTCVIRVAPFTTKLGNRERAFSVIRPSNRGCPISAGTAKSDDFSFGLRQSTNDDCTITEGNKNVEALKSESNAQRSQSRRKRNKGRNIHKFKSNLSQRQAVKSLRLGVRDHGGSEELVRTLLYLQNAKNEREVIETGKKLEFLRVTETESEKVQGFVVRATALTGLVRLAISIIYSLLDEGFVLCPSDYIPVFLTLRRIGRVKTMKEVLDRIATACRTEGVSMAFTNDQHHGAKLSNDISHSYKVEKVNATTAVDLVAINTYIASLCDIKDFDSVLDILRPEKMLNQYNVNPDVCSYNTILMAAAKVGNLTLVEEVTTLLQERDDVDIDIVTINAQLRMAILLKNHTGAISLVDKVLNEEEDNGLKPDKFTVDLALVPLVSEGRIDDAMKLIDGLDNLNPKTMAVYLKSLVDASEMEATKLLFDKYFGVKQSTFSPAARHFNIVIDGFCTENMPTEAVNLFRKMIRLGKSPDAYTLTSLIKISNSVSVLQRIWMQAQNRFLITPTFINYAAYITALGRLSHPSQACLIFDKMENKKGYASIIVWNALFWVLAQPENSKQRLEIPSDGGVSPLNGLKGHQASKEVLRLMKSDILYPDPNSQTYCLVATAMANEEAPIEEALDLFSQARNSGFGGEGRFVNAIIRCYGIDIDAAIKAWKNMFAREVLNQFKNKKAKLNNLKAAHHALLYVCGRAGRADLALRILYAMKKEYIEPDEVALNAYKAGKKRETKSTEVTMNGLYEKIVEVECSKYNPEDKRKKKEKRIRIII